MNYREFVVKGTVRSEHVIQLFDSSESLAESVSAFLAPAYEAGDNLLIVAKPRHWDAIALGLKALGCEVDEGLRTERIIVLNAAATLRAISRNDTPEDGRFDEVVGRLVRDLTRKGGLAIYGEMVEELAEEGNFAAAVKLEDLWNALAERTSFRLMCGYSSAHFAAPASERHLHLVCSAHTQVRTKSDDPLGGWLVKRTRLPFKPELLPVR